MSTFDFGFDDFEDSPREGHLKELVAAYEDDPSSYFDSGDLEEIASFYFEDGRIEKAAAAAKAAVEANPMSVNFHRTHGMILMRQGRDDAARKALKRALELDESDVTARSLLERLAEQSV